MVKNNYFDKYDFIWVLLFGLFFFHIRIGIEKLDPTFTRWLLLPGSDFSYHYLAWEYFKDCPWAWPLGKITGYAYPMENSIMYTDSIPLFAFFFKAFNFILPNDFQYIGLWHASCVLLNTFFGVVLARKIGYDRWVSWIVSIFFTGAVVLVARFGHAALCGQWLILWALTLFVFIDEWALRKLIKHSVLLVITASLVHPYLFFMVLGLNTAIIVQAKKNKELNKSFFYFLLFLPILLGLGGWYISGAFLFKGNLSPGLGDFAANLNTFFNAWDVGRLGKSFPYFKIEQGEGIGYLGLGILILMCIVFYCLIKEMLQKRSVTSKASWFFIACILFFVFALSPKWTLGEYLIIDWKYNDYISRTFRGTGRFIWPMYYFVFYWTFKKLYQYIPLYSRALIVLAVIIQAIDLSPLWKRNEFVDLAPPLIPYENEMASIISKADKIIVYPTYTATIADASDYVYFVNLAQRNKKPISAGYGARFPYSVGKKFRQEVDDFVTYFKKNPKDVLITHVDSLALHQKLLTMVGGHSVQYERYRIYSPDTTSIPSSIASKLILHQEPIAFKDYLVNNKSNFIFGIVSQEGAAHLSKEVKLYFQNLGTPIDSLRYGGSWTFVHSGNKIISQKIENQKPAQDTFLVNCGNTIRQILMQSTGVNSGQSNTYSIFGKDTVLLFKRGLHLVMTDSCGGKLKHVLIDTYISDQFYQSQ